MPIIDSQADAISLLTDPVAMGGAVERIDTHISTVFLVGEHAYKLKRAVTLPFLDYATPALREAACAREVAINRKIAPELYLGTLPVVRRAGVVHLGGDGETVDTVVAMRRFPRGALLSEVAAHGGLTTALLTALATRVAAMHEAATPTAGLGGAAAFARTIDGVATAITELPGAEAWTRDTLAALARLGGLADRRRDAGLVRACHGDLHLGNIALFEGRPVPFDAIEFNEAFSTIDVLYDFAFLLMDFLHRGETAAANVVFNVYLDRRPDIEGLALLPLYMSLRAAIRAEVALARTPGDAADARAYLALARRLVGEPLAASNAAALIAIGGFSGSGKTTLGRKLAPHIGLAPGARHLRTDAIRKRLAGIAETERLAPSHYTRAEAGRVYAALYAEAAATLANGYAVIADAVFAQDEERADIEAVARAARARFAGIWLDIGEDVAAPRLAARVDDASDATISVHRIQAARGSGDVTWPRFDGGRTAQCLAARVRAALGVELFSFGKEN